MCVLTWSLVDTSDTTHTLTYSFNTNTLVAFKSHIPQTPAMLIELKPYAIIQWQYVLIGMLVPLCRRSTVCHEPRQDQRTAPEWFCISVSHTRTSFVIFPYFSAVGKASCHRRCYSAKQATYKDGIPLRLPSINIRSRQSNTNKY